MKLVNKLMVLASAALLVGTVMLVVPEADAGRGGRGSVKQSGSRGGGSRASANRSRGGNRGSANRAGGSNRGSANRARSGNRGSANRAGSGNRGSANRGGSVDRGGNRGGSSVGNRNDRQSNRSNNAGNRQSNRSDRANNRIDNRGNISGNRHHHHHHYHNNRYSYRNDARRDWMRFRTVNHLIRAGTRVLTQPKYSTTVVVTGTTYYYSGGVYYVHQAGSYVVVQPPPTAVVYAVPAPTTVVYVGQTPYFYYNGTYYVATDLPAPRPQESPPPDQQATSPAEPKFTTGPNGENVLEEAPDTPEMIEGDGHNYQVVAPPVGATVPYVPEEAEEKTIDGSKYYVLDGTYYRPFASDDETIYMVTEDPTKT